jgi:hypothetical protein
MKDKNNDKKTGTEIVQPEVSNHSIPEQKPRPYGQWRHQVHISDDFDVLPESIAAAFAGATSDILIL